MVNNKISKILNSFITQFENLGLDLNVTENEKYLLESKVVLTVNPKTKKPFCSDFLENF